MLPKAPSCVELIGHREVAAVTLATCEGGRGWEGRTLSFQLLLNILAKLIDSQHTVCRDTVYSGSNRLPLVFQKRLV